MWPSVESQLAIVAGCLAFIAILWLIAALRLAKRDWSIVGALGTGATALILTAMLTIGESQAMWFVAWAGIYAWPIAASMIFVGFALTWQGSIQSRWPLIGMGALALALNVWAVLVFLWIATVSGGGV